MSFSNQHAKNLQDMLDVAQDCVRTRRHVPALVIVYSLIDSLAWAADDKTNPNLRSRFEQWVKTWFLPLLPLSVPQITETDLYAARCAVLHTGTGVSDLYRRRKARRVMYAWGTAKREELESVIAKTPDMSQHVAVHFDDLLKALKCAVKNFKSAAAQNPTLRVRLEEAASFQYMNVSTGSDA